MSQSPDLQLVDLGLMRRNSGICRSIEERGIVLAYHHHLMIWSRRAEEISAFCEATEDSVGLLLDTGHASPPARTTAKSCGDLAAESCTFILRMFVAKSSKGSARRMQASTRQSGRVLHCSGRRRSGILGDRSVCSDLWLSRLGDRRSGTGSGQSDPEMYAQNAYRYVRRLMF